MEILLEKLHEADMEQLYDFELENRDYFEEMVPSRGDDYYHFQTFKQRNMELLDEQKQGLCYFYLIKNNEGQILGRMNLVDIDTSQGTAHVGYRVGKVFTGKGLAKNALKLLVENASELGLKKIEAKTTTNNIGSQKVLEKSGFKYVETREEQYDRHGETVSFVYYAWEG
ncbi:GNAT family N-acetyltransferase [Bacillus horti]|uniref:Ribosomal-protein-alanine N-acetyltransferase n=1 Tax=Caldalkalibacillus horti TaxID=77523 RepID=A0ABT9W135_9BACI|nr:GNAT family protein [Bacillus horti]MDQ0166978.1 ribosomal-protein-alanine N-acetyltransferase [Bacillus horti]